VPGVIGLSASPSPWTFRLAVGGLLAMPAMLATLWRTFLAQAIVPSGEQLNIATFVIARDQRAYLATDFTYGSGDPSRFYTPLQVDLFDAFWKWGGSIQGAIAIQTVLIVVATTLAAGLSMYLLTHRILPAVVVAAAALNYRSVLSAGDIWGLGPSWTVLPRAWAAPLAFGAIALWLRAVETRDFRYHVGCGLLLAGAINIHPPTGAPLAAAVVGATALVALSDRVRWREPVALLCACTVGALPFIVGYATHIAIAAPVDYESFMAAARLRVDASILPRVLHTLTQSLTPGTDSFTVNGALAGCVTGATVVAIALSSERQRLRELARLTVVLVVASVVVPLAAQLVLLRIEHSPIPTIDLFRGLRLLVPIGLMVGGLGMAAALRSTGWPRLLAFPMSALMLLDIDTAESMSRLDVWPVAIAALLVVALPMVPPIRQRLPLILVLGIGAILFVQPLVSISLATRAGGFCCDVPPQPESELTTTELVQWLKTLEDHAVVETSSVEDNAALRLRIETEHGVTWIAKDGNVLLYSDPAKAVLWSIRSNRARQLVSTRDVAGLREAARDYGASLVLVDRLVWRDRVAGANVVAAWSGISNPTATDWVGVFAVGQPDNAASRLAATYTGGAPEGKIGLTFNGLTFDGTYEVRLFASDSWNRLAVSTQLKVIGSTATVEPAAASAVGPSVAVGWSGVTLPMFENDRFTVFRP